MNDTITEDFDNALSIYRLKTGMKLYLPNKMIVVYWQRWGQQPMQRALYQQLPREQKDMGRTDMPDSQFEEVIELAETHHGYKGRSLEYDREGLP